jgi:hypothetical protein
MNRSFGLNSNIISTIYAIVKVRKIYCLVVAYEYSKCFTYVMLVSNLDGVVW